MDEFTITRDGRTYDVLVQADEAPMNPRIEYDHDATEFYVTQYTYSRWDVYVNELTGEAGNALRHFIHRYNQAGVRDRRERIERAFHLWSVIADSPVRLVIGHSVGHSQSDWHDWYALVDTEVMRRDGYTSTPQEVAEAEAEEYAAYAFGDVYGVTVTLDGKAVGGPLWGIVDRKGDYTRQTAEDMISGHENWLKAEEEMRRFEASKAGAGFIGII